MVLKSKQTRSKKDKKIDLVSEDVVDNSRNEVNIVAAEMENIGKTITNITFMIEELDAKKKLDIFEKSLETTTSKKLSISRSPHQGWVAVPFTPPPPFLSSSKDTHTTPPDLFLKEDDERDQDPPRRQLEGRGLVDY